MRAILPVDAPLIDQLQIRFVDKRRRLQHPITALTRQATAGNEAQFVVHERHESIERVLPVLPSGQSCPSCRSCPSRPFLSPFLAKQRV
jgi:hypothetical protein